MALIQCDGCQKLISEHANKCVYCKVPETAGTMLQEFNFFVANQGFRIFISACALLMLFIGNNIYNGPYYNKVVAEKRWSFWGWEKPSDITCKILMWKVARESGPYGFNKGELSTNVEKIVYEDIFLSYEDVYFVKQDEQGLECMARAKFADGREGNHRFYVEYKKDKKFAPTREGYFATQIGWQEL